MSEKLNRTAALAAILTVTGVGAANATEGWYGRVDAGYSVDGSLDGDIDDGFGAVDFDVDLDDNWMGAAGLGYAFSNGFRFEGELAYRNNDWGPFEETSFIDDTLNGEATALSLMGNLFYDFNRGGGFEP